MTKVLYIHSIIFNILVELRVKLYHYNSKNLSFKLAFLSINSVIVKERIVKEVWKIVEQIS